MPESEGRVVCRWQHLRNALAELQGAQTSDMTGEYQEALRVAIAATQAAYDQLVLHRFQPIPIQSQGATDASTGE